MTRKWDPIVAKNAITKMGASLVLSCLSSQAFAAGFQLNEQNVTNLGLAYSGTAALAEDATTGYYNPAGLTRIPNGQVVLSGVVIESDAKLGATSVINPRGVALTPGSANGGTVGAVPTFHLAKRLDDSFAIGFNVTSPFGLSTRYKEDSIARYAATESEILTMNLEASVAFKFVPCFSIAVGPDAMYTRATLNVRTRSSSAQLVDGYQRNEADGWGWGWHAGALWEPTEDTRVGFNYRSSFVIRLNGNTESLGIDSLLEAVTGAQDTFISRVRGHNTFPEMATLSLYHRFGCWKDLAVTGDLAWTNWSRFRTLRLRYARPIPTSNPLPGFQQFAIVTPDSDTFEHFRDAKRYALGFIYTVCDAWLIRVGGAYDETPIRNEYRTARLPDSDRYWAAIGTAYTYKNWRFDLGYAHLFFAESSLNEHAPYGAQSVTPLTSAALSGDYDSSANLFGLQVRYDFV